MDNFRAAGVGFCPPHYIDLLTKVNRLREANNPCD
jgi:hypothetical protein